MQFPNSNFRENLFVAFAYISQFFVISMQEYPGVQIR